MNSCTKRLRCAASRSPMISSSPRNSSPRNSRSRGKLFYRLVQQAVAVDPTPYRSIVADWDARGPVSPTTRCWGYLSEVDTPLRRTKE